MSRNPSQIQPCKNKTVLKLLKILIVQEFYGTELSTAPWKWFRNHVYNIIYEWFESDLQENDEGKAVDFPPFLSEFQSLKIISQK